MINLISRLDIEKEDDELFYKGKKYEFNYWGSFHILKDKYYTYQHHKDWDEVYFKNEKEITRKEFRKAEKTYDFFADFWSSDLWDVIKVIGVAALIIGIPVGLILLANWLGENRCIDYANKMHLDYKHFFGSCYVKVPNMGWVDKNLIAEFLK